MSSKAQTREKDYERGIRIADRRKAIGLSQDELAHRAGIGRQAFQRDWLTRPIWNRSMKNLSESYRPARCSAQRSILLH